MSDAYIPQKWKDSILGNDYQRVANELRDRGTKITWVNDRPTIGGVVSADYLFMYPQEIKPPSEISCVK